MTKTNQKINCSVPLLTLNSEKYLEECLDSLKNFSDVFLLDGNSADKTLEIAKKYNIPVYKQVKTDEPNVRIADFSAMRRKAISLSKENWILILDSDEFLSPELASEIKNILAKNNNPKIAYSISNQNIINNKIIKYSFNEYCYVRLFHKQSGIEWTKNKVVHEKLKIPNDVKVEKLKNIFFSYTPNYAKCREKDNHYLALVKKKIMNADKPKNRLLILKSLVINFLRAGSIILKSLKVYLRHGFKHSIPPKEVYRYVRYFLIISYLRLRQLFL